MVTNDAKRAIEKTRDSKKNCVAFRPRTRACMYRYIRNGRRYSKKSSTRARRYETTTTSGSYVQYMVRSLDGTIPRTGTLHVCYPNQPRAPAHSKIDMVQDAMTQDLQLLLSKTTREGNVKLRRFPTAGQSAYKKKTPRKPGESSISYAPSPLFAN